MNCVSAPLSVYWSALCVYITAKISSQPVWHFSMNWLWNDTAKGQYAKEWPIQAWQPLTETEYFRVWEVHLEFSISTLDILSICILRISTCFTGMPPHPAARGAHHTVCSADRELKKCNPPKIIKKKMFLQAHIFTQLQRSKRNNGNKSWVAEASDLKSPGREDEQGSWFTHHEVPRGHGALAESTALSSEIKTKALLGGSLRILHLPEQTVFPAKCYWSCLRSLVKMSPLEA